MQNNSPIYLYRGVAQLVARQFWELDVAGSSPVTPTKILTESRVYSPLSVVFYAYLGVSTPLLKKSHFYDHINKCELKIPLSLFAATQELKARATATEKSVVVV